MKLLGYLGMVVLSQLAGCANELPRAGTQVPLRVSAHFPESTEVENRTSAKKPVSLSDNFTVAPFRGLSLNLGEALSTTEPLYSPEKLVDGGEARFASKRALRWFNYRISGSAGVLSSGSTEISDRSQEELEAIEVKVPAGDTIQIEMSFLQMDQLEDDPEALCRSGLPVFARSWVATESVTPTESGEVAVTFREAGRSTLHMAAVKIPSATLKAPSPAEWKFGLRDNITGAVLVKEFCPAELLPTSNFTSDSALVRLPTFALPLKAHQMMVFGPDFKASVDTNNPIQTDFFAGLSGDSAVRASEIALKFGFTAVMELSYANRDNWGIARTSISAILPKTEVSTNTPPQFLSSAVLNAQSRTAPLELTYDLLARNFPGKDDSTNALGYMITSLENSLGTLYRIVNGKRVLVTVPTTLMPADVVFWEPPLGDTSSVPVPIFTMHLVDSELALSNKEAYVQVLLPPPSDNTAPQISAGATQLSTGKEIPIVFSSANMNAFTVSDAESTLLRLKLEVQSGLLKLDSVAGLTFASGSSNNSKTLEFKGSQNDINNALNGMTYTPNSGFIGSDALIVTVTEADTAAGESPLQTQFQITIMVTDNTMPQAPVLQTSQANAFFREMELAVFIDNGITLTGTDNTIITSASVKISSGYSLGDSMSCSVQGKVTCSFDSTQGILSLSGEATVAEYQAALRGVTFISTSENPTSLSPTRTISWTVIDQFASSTVATSTLMITATNDAPTLTTINTINSASEDTFREILYADLAAAADEADVDSETISFRIEAISTGTLEIWNGTTWGAITAGATLISSEDKVRWKGSIDSNGILSAFTVKAFDGALSSSNVVQVAVNVAAVNDAPNNIAISVTSINENMASGSTVGTLTTTDVDAANTFTYTLSGTDAASFAISGASLNTAASFNFEAKSSYAISITTIDQGGLAFTKAFTITVNNMNETPTDIALSATSINENLAIGSTVGTLSTTDVDSGNTFTYTLSGTNAASFEISGASLNTTASFNFESKSSYSIAITTTDQGGLAFTKAFTITVNNMNETPTNIALSATSINENLASGSTVGTLSTIDTDAGNTFTYTLSGTDAASFAISGASLNTTASFNFETKSSYSISITTSDQGGLAFTKNFTIGVNNVNDAPTGLVYCDTLLSGHIFRTGPANGSNWSIGSCGGALDEDGDALTYYLSSPTATNGYSCPAKITATVSGGAIGFSGAFPTNIAGSCGYKLNACDTNSACTSLSTNSIIISSYNLSFDTPTITLSPTCQLVASAPVNMSSNVSGFSVSGSLGSDFGSQTVAMNSSSGIFTTSFYLSDLSDSQFKNTFSLGALSSVSTRDFALTYTVTSGNLSSFSGITIPSGQVMSPAQSTNYSLAVMPEALEPRTNSPNSDGLQPEFASTTSVCRRCNSQNPVVISGGGEHTCLVESGSTLKCWGGNLENQLGDGTTLGKGIPTEILVTNDPRRIVATGSMSTCLVSDSLLNSGNQQLRCWGRIPSSYDTGTASTNFTLQSTAQSGSVLMMNARPIHSVAVSKTSDARGDHYCAIVDSDRKVMCWGNNTSRQAGSSVDQVQPMPVQAGLLSGSTYLLGVQSVATGSTHTCAANSGGVYCWGSGFNGVTGQTPYTSPMLISGLSSTQISQLAAGSNFTCALSADGAVKCWGANTSGQLGNNTTGGMTPSTVTGLDGIAGNQAVAITAGHSHACALKKDGTVLCWGNNNFGQLGMDTNSTTSQQPALVQFGAQGPPLEKVVAISAGAMHTCAVRMDGSTACWGKNSSGQLGFNSNTNTNAAALVYWDSSNTTANTSLRPQMCSTISR